MAETDSFIREQIGRPIVVIGASTGTDAHTVGIDAIMNMKGFAGHYGLERYEMFEALNMGSQVTNEEFIAKAIELKADALLVSQRGIFALRCIGWGIRVFGSIESPQWRVEDNNEKRAIPNPLAQAGAAAAALNVRLAEKGLAAAVQPLAVFADPFDSPRLSLEGGACAVAYGDLKKWYHSQPELPAMDRSVRDEIIRALALTEWEKERKS